MSTYRVTITFELTDGDGIDACTAASLVSERLFSEEPEFRVTSLMASEER